MVVELNDAPVSQSINQRYMQNHSRINFQRGYSYVTVIKREGI